MIKLSTIGNPGRSRTATEEAAEYIVRCINSHDDLVAALLALNHMGGDERGGYCICPKHDGSAPDAAHSTVCANARKALAKATGTDL